MNTTIGVIGTGYLGATQAACMAELGFDVVAADTDPAKIAALSAGQLPFYEPDLAGLIWRHTSSGRLRFTTSVAEVATHADVHFLCVGTPQRSGSLAADTRMVFSAVQMLVPHLTRSSLIVGKSTVPVGTAQCLSAVAAELAPAGVDVEIAWNPEFLREGHAVADTLSPGRLVFGVESETAERTLRGVYATLVNAGVPLVVTDLATAELVKMAANAFLATKISFANAMAELCEATGGDVVTLTEALGYDRRIGHEFLASGLGFGGGCLPKDIRALMARAGEVGAAEALTFLREVDAINLRCRSRMVDLAIEECGGSVSGLRIAALGAAFKPQTDDVRDSPALDVARQLHMRGADVVVTDPKANLNAARISPGLSFVDDPEEAIRGADLVLHLTEWPEFAVLEPARLGALVGRRRILDGRNTLDPTRWLRSGWRYRALGRPGPAPVLPTQRQAREGEITKKGAFVKVPDGHLVKGGRR